jgi:hypothetical protein
LLDPRNSLELVQRIRGRNGIDPETLTRFWDRPGQFS